MKRAAMHGSLWTLGGYGGSQVLRLVVNLILARLLYPGAFGLMALVTVFMQGLEMLSDIGIGPSIIQNKKGEDRAFLNTAWTIQVVRGVALWIVTIICAGPVADFFARSDPSAAQLAHILPVAGIMAVLGGFGSTSLFTLNRKLAMRQLTVLTLAPQVGSFVVSLGWACFDRSVWAIVAGGIAYSVIRLALSHWMNPGARDRFAWDRAAAQELGRFGRWVFASTVLSFLATHLDRIMLGKFLSLAELGLYSIGMTFARVATQIATRLTGTVIFPILARYQDRPERMLEFALKARRAVLWAGGAVCAAFAIFAPVFFGLLYDERYAVAGRISQWLSIYIWTWMLTATIDRIPLALGRPRALFAANVVTTLGMVLAAGGYRLAQLPGFITGMALANVATHLYLVTAIPCRRAALLVQSAGFTVLTAGYALGAVGLLEWLAPRLSKWMIVFAHSALATVPCAVAALVVWRLMRERKSAES